MTVNPAFSMVGLNNEDVPRCNNERGHNYLYSFAWWKPPFDVQWTAPPSYDDAVFNDEHHRPRIMCNEPLPSDFSSSDSGSDAPPYDAIHLDPIIQQPTMPPPHGAEGSSDTRDCPRSNPQSRPAGGALVMPVSIPESYHLNHVELPNNDESSIPHINVDADDNDLHSAVHRLRPRSRDAIILPREERDAVLHRFSLQLNLNVSDTSSSSTSAISPDRRTVSPSSMTSSD